MTYAAWTIAFLGIFAGLFGVGSQRWLFVPIGIGSILLAAGLAVVAEVRRRTPRTVRGVARVLSVSDAPPGTVFARCTMHAVIDAPGIPYATFTVREPRVPVEEWPSENDMLPVVIGLDGMGAVRRVRVLWHEVAPRAAPAAVYDPSEDGFA